MGERRQPFDFEISPEAEQDIIQLNNRLKRNPDDLYTKHLLQVSLNTLVSLRDGHPGTKALEYLPSYPDLSDCRTSYVGGDPNQKPSHRLVWRDVPADHPAGRPRREVIALGRRENGQVYHLAGQRLGRPVGFTLEELSRLREPVRSARPDIAPRGRGIDPPAPAGSIEGPEL